MRLENNLRSNLQVEGLARTESWRAIEVADGVADETVAAHGAGSSREVLAIEDIEHLGTQLNFHALRHRDVLDYGKIIVAEARAIEGIPVNVANKPSVGSGCGGSGATC